ncbi:uncharacterized protein LOC126567628 [Anopheles maculipalpis]|uniref:uncharacterized protein LOC126567628 n=1 Tax=Anopheles maculipalpis TaxID=1496333 RepID=UPI002158E9C2|nr:uncharacterized protein LOC126567628 [Anopheles maculipalpis]
MPYAVVETTTIGSGKKAMVVPETWVISKNDRLGFVHWPDEPCEKKLKELTADDRKLPSEQWEKHLCKIIFRSIPSQTSAEKALAIWQRQFNSSKKDPLKELQPPKLPTKPTVVKPLFPRQNDLFGGFFTVTSRDKLGDGNSSYRGKSLNTTGEALPPELYSVLDELKQEIVSNQEEMMVKIQEGFDEMRKFFTSLLKPNGPLELRGEGAASMKTPDGTFTFQRLMSINDVKQFEAQLASANYRKNVHTWVDSVIWHEPHAAKRMKTMVELMFDQKLLAQFSWFGMYNKEPLYQYQNIRKLLQYITTTPLHQSNPDEVKYLFLSMMNLETSKAGTKKHKLADSSVLDLKDQRRTTTPTKRLSTGQAKVAKQNNNIVDVNGTIDLDLIVQDGETMEFEEIIEHEEILQPDEAVAEKKKSGSDNGRATRKADESLPEISINRITCVAELNIFENELKNAEMQQKVHKWVDSTVVNRETDVEKRLLALLDRLMDKKVLQSLSWMDAKSAKQPLEECKNFVRLFEHASRTVIHQTIIYNHRLVANFFTKMLGDS